MDTSRICFHCAIRGTPYAGDSCDVWRTCMCTLPKIYVICLKKSCSVFKGQPPWEIQTFEVKTCITVRFINLNRNLQIKKIMIIFQKDPISMSGRSGSSGKNFYFLIGKRIIKGLILLCAFLSLLLPLFVLVSFSLLCFFFFFFDFCLFTASPTACGSSQTRGWMGAVAVGLYHRSQLTATLDPQTTEQSQGLNLHPHGY